MHVIEFITKTKYYLFRGKIFITLYIYVVVILVSTGTPNLCCTVYSTIITTNAFRVLGFYTAHGGVLAYKIAKLLYFYFYCMISVQSSDSMAYHLKTGIRVMDLWFGLQKVLFFLRYHDWVIPLCY